MKKKKSKGKVYIVGAGPGSPGLVTLRANELIFNADVLVVDALVNPEIYNDAPAVKIFVGKRGGRPGSTPQSDIHKILIKNALLGHRVVRLKGGDPFVFGRGAEEAERLKKAGIPFEIVPGITSAIAAPAYAGVSVTHRRYASAVAFITGHEDPDKKSALNLDYPSLSSFPGTLVFLMGIKQAKKISSRLIREGKSPGTPVIIIEKGTLPGQRETSTTLGKIDETIKKHGIKPPAIIVAGDVVKSHKNLKWLPPPPLEGKTIVITRAHYRNGPWLDKLKKMGASPVPVPVIDFDKPDKGYKEIFKAIDNNEEYKYVIFTSPTGVTYFHQLLKKKKKDMRWFYNKKIAVIGQTTAEVFYNTFGFPVDIVPGKDFTQEGLLKRLNKEKLHGKKILIPRAQTAREVLIKTLKARGGKVDCIPIYKTVIPEKMTGHGKKMKNGWKPDIITFTSASTVKNFFEIFTGIDLSGVDIVSIGPITTGEIIKHGLKPVLEAGVSTLYNMADDMGKYYEKKHKIKK